MVGYLINNMISRAAPISLKWNTQHMLFQKCLIKNNKKAQYLHSTFFSGSNFQQQSVQKSSFSSSSTSAASTQQVKSILKQPSAPKHGEEIHQESLKSTIQSAITDIEEGKSI